MFRFTIRDVLWLTVVVAVALSLYFVKPRRTQWEFKQEDVYWYDLGKRTDGNEGWELVQADKDGNIITLYFKRPK